MVSPDRSRLNNVEQARAFHLREGGIEIGGMTR